MGPAAPFIAVAVLSTAFSAQQQRKAAKAQEEASKQASAAEQVSQQQQTRQQIRQNRVRRAQLAQAASSSGAGTSSAASGTAAGLSTDLASNLAFQQGQINTANNITSLNQQAADANARAQLGSSVTSLALFGANRAGS